MHSGNKAQIPGPSLEGDELGDGPSNDASQVAFSHQGPSSQVEPRVEPDDPASLGKPGLLGEAIIPLSEPDAPHAHRLQRPASPNPIKVATPEASRAPTSPGPVPLESSRDPAPSNMIFSDLVKSPRTTFTKFRNSFPHGVQPPLDFDPDLVSRDKVKNREAVNRYLAERVRNDWEFTWPPVVNSASASAEPAASAQDEKAQTANGDPQEAGDGAAAAVEDAPRDPGAEADPESDAESVYSTISEDTTRFRPRAEWTSDLSDDDEPCPSASPFRFGSPDAVGAAVRESIEMKRARRRRAVREEMKWNPGLACFEARRNAWTGAKTVRVKPKPPSPVSPSSARRLFWRHHRTQSSISHSAVVASGSPPGPSSPVSPTATRTSTTTASDSDSGAVQRTVSRDSTAPRVLHPVQTVVPVAPPLLPPQNPMRASVQPAMYSSLYDKVVTQSLQPACPVNLSDMLRACVVGWKRDGEWPPKSVYPAPAPVEASNAQVLAVRQQKAQQQRNKNAAAAEAAASKGRRLSLVGLFGTGGGTGGGNKTASRTTTTPAATQEANGANNKESKEDELRRSQSNDDVAGSSGKTLFRRSLQRVLSLGQHGHAHGAVSGNGVEGPLSPTSPTTKEVTAAT